MLSVLNSFQKIKLLPILTVSLAVALSACNTMSTNSDAEPLTDSANNAAPDIQKESASPNAAEDSSAPSTDELASSEVAPPKKQVSLDGDSLFNLLAAEFAGNSGDIEASMKYYGNAAATIEDSRIAQRSAYIALYGKKYEETLTALERWQALDPDSKDLPRMYAVTYLKLERPEEAVPHIEKILARDHEDSIDEAMAVKQLLGKEATTEDAYVVLQKLNQKEEKNKHLLVLQSRYAAQLKHYDEALSLLDEVLVIDASLHEVSIIKSRILTAQGKHEEAALIVQQVLQEHPENNDLRLQYARMLVEQRKMPAATKQYEILQENLPNDGEISLSLALLYVETKKIDEASAMLEHLVDIDKKVSIANYYLGRIAQSEGDDKQSVAYYLRVTSGDYHFDAQLRVGVILAQLGKPDEGLAKLEALAEEQTIWSLRVKAYLAQGEVLRSQNRFREGVEMYSRALQQKRDDTNLLYARGLMAEKVDRLDMAEEDFLKVISKEPDNANALNALGYTLADRTARYQEALEYIKRAAALVPDDPAILDSLGWVSFRLGKMDDALRWLSKAFEKLEDAEIAAHYGEVLWQTNQKDKARVIWGKGKALNPDNPVLIETLERIKP